MQTFKITLRDESVPSTREVQVEATSVELAHKDGYFHHATQKEEITSISNEAGDVLYTDTGGFSTMPQQPPAEAVPDMCPDDIVQEIIDEGSFERFSDNVNYL